MTREEAIEFWKFKYDRAKDYKDEHWEAEERHAHYDYVNAMQMALDALKEQHTIAEIGQTLRDVLGRFCETLSHMNLAKALQEVMEKQKEMEKEAENERTGQRNEDARNMH